MSETFEPENWIRKNFLVSAKQVTAENMEAVAKWAHGEYHPDGDKKDVQYAYVHISTYQPPNSRISKSRAVVGDWVVKDMQGWKIFTEKSFHKTYEQDLPSAAKRKAVASLIDECLAMDGLLYVSDSLARIDVVNKILELF